jgi:membrane protease YdiL (CAAX protease family)
VDDETLVLRLMLTAGLSVAGVGALVALVLYALSRASRDPLFPPAGPLCPAVNGFALIGAFVVFVVGFPVAATVLSASGFYHRLYGPDFPSGWPEPAANTVRYLWAATVAFPVQLALIVGLVRALGGVKPLDGRWWTRHAVAGYLTWLMVTPAAFLVFVVANVAHAWLTGQPPDKHPLTALGDAGGREWALFVLQTVVLAPVLEELVFRGLLLPWLADRRPLPPAESPLSIPPPVRPLLVMFLAVGVATVLHVNDVRKAWTAGDHVGAAAHLIPGLFFLLLVPLEFVPLTRLRRHLRIRSRQHVRAILASSALFGAFHASVWPSPVPLVVLAVGLGYLYLRTRSLVGPVVVHGLFNAVSAVYLLLGGPA